MRRFIAIGVALLASLSLVSRLALADPLAGEVLKFQQLPLNNGLLPVPSAAGVTTGALFPGHDEVSTATLTPNTGGPLVYQGPYMADDFADKFSTPVVHVRWWGSYLQNFTGNTANPFVKQFMISFESDVPANDPTNTTGYSHPGAPLLSQIVSKGILTPGSGTFAEKVVTTPTPPGSPNPIETLYQYNAELNLGKFFPEQRDTVYWLKIVALVGPQRDGAIQWGWHNRDYSILDPLASSPPAVSPGETNLTPGAVPFWHFQDDAVAGSNVTVTVSPNTPTTPTITETLGTPTHYIFPYDGGDNIGQFSKDLAFELYTSPEPNAMFLILSGLALIAAWRRKA